MCLEFQKPKGIQATIKKKSIKIKKPSRKELNIRAPKKLSKLFKNFTKNK